MRKKTETMEQTDRKENPLTKLALKPCTVNGSGSISPRVYM